MHNKGTTMVDLSGVTRIGTTTYRTDRNGAVTDANGTNIGTVNAKGDYTNVDGESVNIKNIDGISLNFSGSEMSKFNNTTSGTVKVSDGSVFDVKDGVVKDSDKKVVGTVDSKGNYVLDGVSGKLEDDWDVDLITTNPFVSNEPDSSDSPDAYLDRLEASKLQHAEDVKKQEAKDTKDNYINLITDKLGAETKKTESDVKDFIIDMYDNKIELCETELDRLNQVKLEDLDVMELAFIDFQIQAVKSIIENTEKLKAAREADLEALGQSPEQSQNSFLQSLFGFFHKNDAVNSSVAQNPAGLFDASELMNNFQGFSTGEVQNTMNHGLMTMDTLGSDLINGILFKDGIPTYVS